MARRDSFRISLTLAGATYLLFLGALLVISLIQRLNLLTLFFALAATPWFVALGQAWLNVRRLGAMVRAPREVHAGRTVALELEIGNHRRWQHSLALVARVELTARTPAAAIAATRAETALPAIAPGGQIRARVAVGPLERGVYSVELLELASRFPFGFVEGRVRKHPDEELLVYPRIGTLGGRLPSQPFSGAETSPRRTAFQTSQLDEYRHLREYRPGDNPRHVHWRSTARRGELMVKEFEPDGTNPTVLVLDPWLPPSATEDQIRAVEFLVSFAATLCVDAARTARDRLLLGIAGRAPIVVDSSGGQRWLANCLDELARLEPGSDTDLAACVAELGRRRRGNAMLWILSSRAPNGTEELAGALERGSGGGARLGRPHWLGIAEIEKIFSVDRGNHGKTESAQRENSSA